MSYRVVGEDNDAIVVGTSPTGQQVTDDDPSHYIGRQPTAITDPDIVEPEDGSVKIFLPISIAQ